MEYHALTWHNYLLPGIYHITLTQLPGREPFSVVEGTPSEPVVTLTPFGHATEAILKETLNQMPSFFLGTYRIMPDHIHMVVTVLEILRRSIRSEIAVAKSQISKAYSRMRGLRHTESVFVKDFHHRVIFNADELEICKRYVSDNPRRLLVKRERPELFRTYHHLAVGDMEMAAYGNIFLLRDFHKQQVRIHRAWTDGEFSEYKRHSLLCAENGGVLVSPFIHPREREIRDEALLLGARIIHLRIDGFRERFKPSGRDFELCSQGRLLLLAPWPDNADTDMTRTAALSMNDMARYIASIDYSTPTLLRAAE